MKSILVILVCLMGPSAFAKQNWAKTMPKWCAAKLLKSEEVRDGSVQSSAEGIVDELKADWKADNSASKASYDECGSSDFYYIVVDKATCTVEEFDAGDSDGECE